MMMMMMMMMIMMIMMMMTLQPYMVHQIIPGFSTFDN